MIGTLSWLGLSRISDNWANFPSPRLVSACADFGLHLLTKSSTTEEHVFAFGGGLSGHHGKVNDMAYAGGRGEDSTRYLATVSGFWKCELPTTHGKA